MLGALFGLLSCGALVIGTVFIFLGQKNHINQIHFNWTLLKIQVTQHAPMVRPLCLFRCRWPVWGSRSKGKPHSEDSGTRQVRRWRRQHHLHHQKEALLYYHPWLWQTCGNSKGNAFQRMLVSVVEVSYLVFTVFYRTRVRSLGMLVTIHAKSGG